MGSRTGRGPGPDTDSALDEPANIPLDLERRTMRGGGYGICKRRSRNAYRGLLANDLRQVIEAMIISEGGRERIEAAAMRMQ